MQTQNPLMDEIAKLTQAAMGMAQAAGEEAKTAFRAQGDRLVAEFDLIRRDEFDALKAELASLRAEILTLKGANASSTAAEKPAAQPAPRARTPQKPATKQASKAKPKA
jgi:BMFP domain-containing protein YqiC